VKKDPANAQIQLCDCFTQTSENTKGTIKNGQSRDTGGIGYTKHKMKTSKTENTTLCVGHHYTQTNTNDLNKTRTLLHITEGKDEANIVLCGNCSKHHNIELRT